MRRILRPLRRPVLVTLATAIALVVPASGQAANYGRKIDDSVTAIAGNPYSTSETLVPVLIYGTDLYTANKAAGITPERTFESIGGESAVVKVSQLSALEEQPGVTYVAVDAPVGPTGKTVATIAATASTIANLFPAVDGAPTAWEKGYRGEGIGIAVIDSGTYADDDFGTRLSQTTLAGQPPGQLNDEFGHGTFVTSIATGSSPDGRHAGIAPAATIYTIDVSRGSDVYSSDVITGLEWVLKKNATKKNIRVVVLSLSETIPSSYQASAMDRMVEKLWQAGVVVVVSAGNLGPGAAVYAPSNDPFVITVGAFDDRGTLDTFDDAETSWSTSGYTQDGFSKPDLLAPGRRVAALVPSSSLLGTTAAETNVVEPGYIRMSGTSFSAPQVAGAAALLIQAHPKWTADQVKWVLMGSARPVPDGTAGALDIGAALQAPNNPDSANQGIAASTYATPGDTTEKFGHANSWDKSAFWGKASKWDKSAFWGNGAYWNKTASWNKSAFWGDDVYWDRSAFWKSAFWGEYVAWAGFYENG